MAPEEPFAESLEVGKAPDPGQDLGPPPTLSEAALYGLAGLVVRGLARHTEADPAAILLQFLAAFGNILGPAPHCMAGATRHGLNLFVVLVGEGSKPRKGNSWHSISRLFTEADPHWVARCVTASRPTAYRILHALRDQPPTDRRLFLLAEEFASVLHLLSHDSGQLSPLLRSAWDGGDLYAHNGTHLLCATNAHLSMVAHITPGELAHRLTRPQAHNGFAGRCLWINVRRSRSVPGGCSPADGLSAAAGELRSALHWAQSQSELVFRPAKAAGNGAVISRDEAQVLRLSAIYAALDRSAFIEPAHLQAALAVWDYCQAGARLFFDAAPIDPTARRIS